MCVLMSSILQGRNRLGARIARGKTPLQILGFTSVFAPGYGSCTAQYLAGVAEDIFFLLGYMYLVDNAHDWIMTPSG